MPAALSSPERASWLSVTGGGTEINKNTSHVMESGVNGKSNAEQPKNAAESSGTRHTAYQRASAEWASEEVRLVTAQNLHSMHEPESVAGRGGLPQRKPCHQEQRHTNARIPTVLAAVTSTVTRTTGEVLAVTFRSSLDSSTDPWARGGMGGLPFEEELPIDFVHAVVFARAAEQAAKRKQQNTAQLSHRTQGGVAEQA